MTEFRYYYADWCRFCKIAGPAIERAAESTGIPVRKIDVDIEGVPEDVQGLPTVVLVKDGQEVARKYGAAPQRVYEEMVSAQLNPR